ncbi:MAG: hypothetical protein PHQ43_12340, partial [Dehalococcoidales bacterium]|nr:hypothetical protein [Dehalococcoidales bacterium]
MGYTTTAELADTIPTVIEQARFTSQFKAIMSSLCWKSTKKLHEGSTKNFPYWGTVTAQSLTEGQDMSTAEQMEDTLVTITPSEVGCKIILTDKLLRDNQEDVKR